MAWVKTIPLPPNEIKIVGGEPVVPNGWVRDSDYSMHTLGYHPNAAYGIRSKTPSSTDSAAQAMYDKSGKIITGGVSAGSADKVSTAKSLLGHWTADVTTFDDAKELDIHYGGDKYRELYLEVRPPNVDPSAPENIVD